VVSVVDGTEWSTEEARAQVLRTEFLRIGGGMRRRIWMDIQVSFIRARQFSAYCSPHAAGLDQFSFLMTGSPFYQGQYAISL
jgi:hypothetical protein